MNRLRSRFCRTVVSAAIAGLVTVLILGCQHAETAAPVPQPTSPQATPEATTTTPPSPTCEGVEGGESDIATYRTKGKELTGDVDGDGRPDRVTLRTDETRPAPCQYLLVVALPAGTRIAAAVKPLSWPGTDPTLLLLAEINGRQGLELVIALSPAAVYRPGAVFTLRDQKLVRMRLMGIDPGELFPFDDEFPAGVDCAGEPGTIVVTFGGLAQEGRDDRHWDITRSVYRAAGSRFELIGEDTFRVDVGPGAQQRWPELGGDPFPSCPERVA